MIRLDYSISSSYLESVTQNLFLLQLEFSLVTLNKKYVNITVYCRIYIYIYIHTYIHNIFEK